MRKVETQTELFPEEAREAQRNRTLQQRARMVGAKMRLADDASGMQEFILAALRRHGPSGLCTLYIDLADLCEGADQADIMNAQWTCFRVTHDMWKAGTLWKHEWEEDVWAWGIRGEQNKEQYIRGIETAIFGSTPMEERA